MLPLCHYLAPSYLPLYLFNDSEHVCTRVREAETERQRKASLIEYFPSLPSLEDLGTDGTLPAWIKTVISQLATSMAVQQVTDCTREAG